MSFDSYSRGFKLLISSHILNETFVVHILACFLSESVPRIDIIRYIKCVPLFVVTLNNNGRYLVFLFPTVQLLVAIIKDGISLSMEKMKLHSLY